MMVRRGVTRTVLVTEYYAIKIPSLRAYGNGLPGLMWSIARGILANQSESEWWRHSCPYQRQFLCPVLASWAGGLVNIYPRCEPFDCSEEQELGMFHRTWRPVPELDPHPGDLKKDNYGWLNGQLVCLDYDMNYNGCPHDRAGVLNLATAAPEEDP